MCIWDFCFIFTENKRDMYARYEEIKGSDSVLVIDELNDYKGECYLYDFIDCIDDSK